MINNTELKYINILAQHLFLMEKVLVFIRNIFQLVAYVTSI